MISYHNISTLSIEQFFDGYVLTTNKSTDDPEILLEIPLEMLLGVLESSVDAVTASLHLRNNGESPVLVLTCSHRDRGEKSPPDVRAGDEVDVAPMVDPNPDPSHDKNGNYAHKTSVHASEREMVSVHEISVVIIAQDSI